MTILFGRLVFGVTLLASSLSFADTNRDECTERILAAKSVDKSQRISNDESIQKLAFCTASFATYQKTVGAGAGFVYGAIGGNGNYSESEFKQQKTRFCLAQSDQRSQDELNSRVMGSISAEQLRQICPAIKFSCQFDKDSLQIVIHYHETNQKIRGYFSRPLASGSLRVTKGAIVEGQPLFPNEPGGFGYSVPLQIVKGHENEFGKVTLPIGFGTGATEIGEAESCIAVRPAAVEPRQTLYTIGSSELESPTIVRPTFSRIRNDELDLNYEWFSFITPRKGKVEVQLYAQKKSLKLRIHSGVKHEPVKGNDMIVQPGTFSLATFEAIPNAIYTVGIQANSGGATGAQLDVSYSAY